MVDRRHPLSLLLHADPDSGAALDGRNGTE